MYIVDLITNHLTRDTETRRQIKPAYTGITKNLSMVNHFNFLIFLQHAHTHAHVQRVKNAIKKARNFC